MKKDIWREIEKITGDLPVQKQRAVQDIIAGTIEKERDEAFMEGYVYAITVLEDGKVVDKIQGGMS